MHDVSEQEIHLSMRTDKTYVSPTMKGFADQKVRIANKVFDNPGGHEFALVKGEVILRETPAGRFQIKATFFETSRGIQTLTIQKFTKHGGKEYFTFLPGEVTRLLKFLTDIKRINFPDEGKVNIADADLEQLLLSPEQIKRVAGDNQQLLAALARNEITTEDVVALGYRKRELRVFDRFLTEPAFFKATQEHRGLSPEGVWQRFFERNPWIFGTSLSLIHFGPLDDRKMEQVVRGFSVMGPGKRVDALLRSHALISTTCFVEIKRHDTSLVSDDQYRSGIWQPSKELSGAVAQVQGTVAAALDQWQSQETVYDVDGNPTGEVIFTTEPRSYVICGSLTEFQTNPGVNDRKFRSFELYRRNLVRPEVVTFDELYQRARLIVEADQGSTNA
ncbi:MAG: DUF4263 domain-containing protein [Mesorhizobium sp.]|uniref:Shedu immune nuclease family protein n=1 Tax=unclassified Mesorhizobium TaxID=325217 RepID=UPI000FCB5008|nr:MULTISPECIES: Shedu immune nuclease family protein [unclassified Mesorhizobium]MCT2581126.1 DUF4263 domain-containing protein [Mesorhizobium sp. P13.3]MDF3170114.1 DUF4263 domain-containing protein [Mesorhizobium sp. P16.1]MDF3181435.1 DUF4263 domain-containing protein [Mesorhizobium sp. P17.1]MDF3187038.1 DUF4263 domain-containing protein [Mesorhizobium sp. ICCV3110.1]RUV56572.1 DUF4263 domain-containing protein [Mesorhizobium sp. M1A.F.Ca.IN.022.02.1.1]